LRRVLMVLAVAALMAAMMVGASPAMAQDFYVLDDDWVDCDWGDCNWNDGWWGFGTAELDECYSWDGEYLCEWDF
jgi:hypothetical protein